MKQRNGFTLYELLIVLAIVSIMATIGTVSLLSFKQRVQLSGLANVIKSDINRAKVIATRHKSSVVSQIHDGFHELFVDNGAAEESGREPFSWRTDPVRK